MDLDDVTVVGRTFWEQLDNMRKVFKRFRWAQLKPNPKKIPTLSEGITVPGEYHIAGRNNHRPREAEGRMGMADTEGQTRTKELLSLVYLLWAVGPRLRCHRETADHIYRREASHLRKSSVPHLSWVTHSRRRSSLATCTKAQQWYLGPTDGELGRH
jgi:hypothetical protein